ncbi:MAG: hypothetical protein IJ381_01440 [Clostridia bacterium]|nr:hypothetical protein [Clostridia bacterium]
MIKKQIGALIVTILTGVSVWASAQTLPSNEVFSPGLVRLSSRMGENPPVRAQAQITIDDAFYARDLSLLSAMLEGTTFEYEGGSRGDRMSIVRGNQVLGEYAVSGEQLTLGGQTYALEKEKSMLEQLTGEEIPGYAAVQEMLVHLQDDAILERVPLSAVADYLEGFRPGDSLPFGYVVTEAITFKRTMSDDGMRLTRVDVESGQIARKDEAPYVLTGYMRQPAGRAPKDTFELVLWQDDRNFLELSYSALRENTIKSRNKKGETNVRTQLKAAGKIDGYGISSRLTVTMGNLWEADGEALSEKITISATLTHQDNTPGRRMQRLNKANVSLRNVIRLTTHEAGDAVFSLTDAVTLEAKMDENTFLAAKADMKMEIGGEEPENKADSSAESITEARMTLDSAAAASVKELSAAVYQTLNDTERAKAQKGLE